MGSDGFDLRRDQTPIYEKFVVKEGHAYRIYAERNARPFSRLARDALLNTDDLCEIFGCSMRTIYRWVSERGLEPEFQVGREYLFTKGEILEWFEENGPERGRPPM
jgi:excisionase family DNA binding protein